MFAPSIFELEQEERREEVKEEFQVCENNGAQDTREEGVGGCEADKCSWVP